jgi:hypothetical protein
MNERVGEGSMNLEKLEAITSVSSVGLDMICIPGDTDESAIAGLIADEAAIVVLELGVGEEGVLGLAAPGGEFRSVGTRAVMQAIAKELFG